MRFATRITKPPEIRDYYKINIANIRNVLRTGSS